MKAVGKYITVQKLGSDAFFYVFEKISFAHQGSIYLTWCN